MKNWIGSSLHMLTKIGLRRKPSQRRRQPRQYSRPLRIEALEGRTMLTVWTVNTSIDEANGIAVGGISLRDALNEAAPSGDTIRFSTNSADGLDGGTIILTHGQIAFGKSLTIDASMLSNGVTIDAGNGTDHTFGTGDGVRIFNITDPTFGNAPPLVTLIGLRLTGGDTPGSGGAISSAGQLVIRDCSIDHNASGQGGGIFVLIGGSGANDRVALSIEHSHIDHNTSDSTGGGVCVQGSHAGISVTQGSSISGGGAMGGVV